MQKKTTERGFSYFLFTDANGAECTLQESSADRDEPLVWLGCSEIGLKRFTPGQGWEAVQLEDDMHKGGVGHVANNRMHLTLSQVRDLLPVLQHFAETGELP